MKTPEEIKRGFEICLRAPFNSCDGCAYDEKNCPQCVESLVRDALAYIQQLEQDNAQKGERIRQLEQEKEALMHDLRVSNWNGDCQHCKHVKKAEDGQLCVNPVTLRLNCDKCVVVCQCRTCRGGSNWEWRGVEEEKHE